MKTITTSFVALCTMFCFGQMANDGDIVIKEEQQDDTYRAGETVKVNANIQGDLVVAGGNIIINDSIQGDLTVAGGELFLNGHITDDARLAVGKVTIDSEIGDDLVVFGGEVVLTENARIYGNLKCFASNLEIHSVSYDKSKF